MDTRILSKTLKIAVISQLMLGLYNVSLAEKDTYQAAKTYTKASTAFMLRGNIWKSRSIPVCWENPSALNVQERDWVQNSILSTWQRFSEIDFTGWDQCQAVNPGIHIKISDNGPHTKDLGNHLDGMKDGMELNFNFLNWSQVCSTTPEKREFCIRSIAVHEFGHALSFAHEQNRPDTPNTCKEAPQGGDGDIMIGKWDLSSVMNYCNPNYNGNGILSTTDRLALQQYYGKKLWNAGFEEGSPLGWNLRATNWAVYHDPKLSHSGEFYLASNDIAKRFDQPSVFQDVQNIPANHDITFQAYVKSRENIGREVVMVIWELGEGGNQKSEIVSKITDQWQPLRVTYTKKVDRSSIRTEIYWNDHQEVDTMIDDASVWVTKKDAMLGVAIP